MDSPLQLTVAPQSGLIGLNFHVLTILSFHWAPLFPRVCLRFCFQHLDTSHLLVSLVGCDKLDWIETETQSTVFLQPRLSSRHFCSHTSQRFWGVQSPGLNKQNYYSNHCDQKCHNCSPKISSRGMIYICSRLYETCSDVRPVLAFKPTLPDCMFVYVCHHWMYIQHTITLLQ